MRSCDASSPAPTSTTPAGTITGAGPLAVRSGLRDERRADAVPRAGSDAAPAAGPRAPVPDPSTASSTTVTSGSTGSTSGTPRGTFSPTTSRSPTPARPATTIAGGGGGLPTPAAIPRQTQPDRRVPALGLHRPGLEPGGDLGAGSDRRDGAVRIRLPEGALSRRRPRTGAFLDVEAELDTLSPSVATVTTTACARERTRRRRTPQEHDPGRGGQRGALAPRCRPTRPVVAPRPRRPAAVSGRRRRRDRLRGGRAIDGSCRTGLRQVRVRNFVATVNGERLFLKGANYGPTRRALARRAPRSSDRDVTLARQAGLDLLRVHGHMAGRGSSTTRPTPGDARLAGPPAAVGLWPGPPPGGTPRLVRRSSSLGHHPSIAVWCGHNEPLSLEIDGQHDARRPRSSPARSAGQVLPSWNKTALDRSIRRALERRRRFPAGGGPLRDPAPPGVGDG